MKYIIRLTESELHRLISKVTRRVIRESVNTNYIDDDGVFKLLDLIGLGYLLKGNDIFNENRVIRLHEDSSDNDISDRAFNNLFGSDEDNTTNTSVSNQDTKKRDIENNGKLTTYYYIDLSPKDVFRKKTDALNALRRLIGDYTTKDKELKKKYPLYTEKLPGMMYGSVRDALSSLRKYLGDYDTDSKELVKQYIRKIDKPKVSFKKKSKGSAELFDDEDEETKMLRQVASKFDIDKDDYGLTPEELEFLMTDGKKYKQKEKVMWVTAGLTKDNSFQNALRRGGKGNNQKGVLVSIDDTKDDWVQGQLSNATYNDVDPVERENYNAFKNALFKLLIPNALTGSNNRKKMKSYFINYVFRDGVKVAEIPEIGHRDGVIKSDNCPVGVIYEYLREALNDLRNSQEFKTKVKDYLSAVYDTKKTKAADERNLADYKEVKLVPDEMKKDYDNLIRTVYEVLNKQSYKERINLSNNPKHYTKFSFETFFITNFAPWYNDLIESLRRNFKKVIDRKYDELFGAKWGEYLNNLQNNQQPK
jgi:hypothetical protein